MVVVDDKKISLNIGLGETKLVRIEDFYNYVEDNDGLFEILTPNGFQRIGDVYIKYNKNIFVVKLEDESSLIGSEDHLVLVDTSKNTDEELNDNIEILDGNTWIRLKNLTQNDWIVTENGSHRASEIEYLGTSDTYDLEVISDEHSYISNGIVSHNTGKSSIAEGLALRIVQKKCSRTLFNKRVIMLDIASLVSGTKYRGQFEERIKALMMEVEKNPDVILFIDEIHTIIGAGSSSGSLDASNMFKPALARGEIQIIGATTLDEYRKHIEKDGALERRFQKVLVEPASPEETLMILNNIRQNYESHHNVTYTDEALKACVDLTNRYMADRFLPDKAIDALDESGARVHISNIVVPKEITEVEGEIDNIKEKKSEVVRSQKYEEAAKLRDVEKNLLKRLDDLRKKWEDEMKLHKQIVTEENVAEVVSMMTGVPLQKVSLNDNSKLQNMFGELKNRIIGQDDAVKKVVKAIQRGRVGLKDVNKPFSGLLIGNSGVGKTELAKQLAKLMFDSEDSLIRLDMSEYSEKIDVSKLIGSSAGYVGYDDGSPFLNKVRSKPYSVILLDEIEKANPEIFNVFLQMLDDGQLTDSHGRKIDFKNCIILMTSNVGTKVAKDFGNGLGFNAKKSNKEDLVKDILVKELKKKFAPEFINRIDEVIYFRDLDKDDIGKIIDIELGKFHTKLGNIGFTATIDDSLKQILIDSGFDPEYGARPLKREIQRNVDDPLTEFIIENSPVQGSHFIMSYDKDTESTIVCVQDLKKKKVTKKKNEDI